MAKTKFEIEGEDKTGAAFRSVGSNLQSLVGELGVVGKAAAGIGTLIAGAFSFQAIASGFREAIRLGAEAEKLEARVGAVVKATGSAAGLTTNQLFDLADSIASITQFDDESIKEAIATLLTFPNVAGDAFKKGIGLAADLATVLKTDVTSAAQLLGKALNDPVEGLTALQRLGIRLSDSQKELAKSLFDTGQTAKAQDVILTALASRIGGAAAGENAGLAKASADAKKAYDDFLEALGRTPTVGASTSAALKGTTLLLRGLEQAAKDSSKAFEEQIGVRKPEPRRIGEALGPTIPGLQGLSATEVRARQEAIDGQLKAQREQQAAQAKQLREEFLKQHDALFVLNKDIEEFARLRKIGAITEDEFASALGDSFLKYGKTQQAFQGFDRDAERFIKIRQDLLSDIRKSTRDAQTDIVRDERTQALQRVAIAEQEFRDKIKFSEAYGEERKQLEAELQNFVIAATERAIEQTKTPVEKLLDEWLDATHQMKQATADWLSSSADYLTDFVLTGKFKFREFAESIIRDIVRIQIQQGIARIGQSIFGGVVGSGTGAEFAEGGFVAFADGGRPPVGRASLVGEEGPELFVPDSAGTIVPNGQFGGGVINVYQTNNFQSGVTRSEFEAGLRRNVDLTKAAVAEAVQRGGPYRSAFQV